MSGRLWIPSIAGECLARYLDGPGPRALPQTRVCDNGRERTSKAMFFWSQKAGVTLHFIQPGKPTQNAFMESFYARFRDACLRQHWFWNGHDARQIINAWRDYYNYVRPHLAHYGGFLCFYTER